MYWVQGRREVDAEKASEGASEERREPRETLIGAHTRAREHRVAVREHSCCALQITVTDSSGCHRAAVAPSRLGRNVV
jgi:hypothetical protein